MTLLKRPSHPGEVLAGLYLEPLGTNAISLAKRLNVPRTRIERLLNGQTTLSIDTEFWTNLQRGHDLACACGTVDLSAITPLTAA